MSEDELELTATDMEIIRLKLTMMPSITHYPNSMFFHIFNNRLTYLELRVLHGILTLFAIKPKTTRKIIVDNKTLIKVCLKRINTLCGWDYDQRKNIDAVLLCLMEKRFINIAKAHKKYYGIELLANRNKYRIVPSDIFKLTQNKDALSIKIILWLYNKASERIKDKNTGVFFYSEEYNRFINTFYEAIHKYEKTKIRGTEKALENINNNFLKNYQVKDGILYLEWSEN